MGYPYRVYNPALDAYVEISKPIERVVSLHPGVTETLFMMGLGHKIVATDAFSYRPSEAKKLPKIGSYTHVKWEALEELKPDIIFTTTGAQRELTKALIEKGYKVYPVPVPITVHDIITGVVVVGTVMGEFESTRTLERSLVDAVNKLTKVARKIKVYVEFDLGGPITPGFPTHVSDAIRLLGGVNIFDDNPTAYFEPNPDEVRKRSPDIVIVEPKRLVEHEVARLKDNLIARGLGEFLESNRVVFTQGDFLAHTGPSFVTEAMPWLANVLSNAGKSHNQ